MNIKIQRVYYSLDIVLKGKEFKQNYLKFVKNIQPLPPGNPGLLSQLSL